jgi:lactate dehydrogenase-like 2-hydroxyacid dehydrogenase|tara:strand:- start:544 stop:1326 length:783 start_codon:yes stop_codon:yes gene_type:complete
MIILKDKKDIKFAPETFLKDYEWESHGQYDSLNFINKDVKVLSVQFSTIGEKSYRAFPNLEWIIVRQHGYDNVNFEECEKRNIGVVTTKPFAQSTADWINQFVDADDKVLLIGNGAIGSKVKCNNISILNRGKVCDKADFDTMILTIPPENNKHFLNNEVLKNFKGKLISVSRSDVIDNKALLDNIDNISHAYIDTLGDEYRKELLDTGKVTYTKHTAFEYGFSYENNATYFEDLEQQIKDCLNDLVSRPVLRRSERVMF